jgi:hypothetical protein
MKKAINQASEQTGLLGEKINDKKPPTRSVQQCKSNKQQ